jgi:hypothetical protein
VRAGGAFSPLLVRIYFTDFRVIYFRVINTLTVPVDQIAKARADITSACVREYLRFLRRYLAGEPSSSDRRRSTWTFLYHCVFIQYLLVMLVM